MNIEERKQKALKKIEDMKAGIAEALAEEKKAIAKAKRQAKKLASGHVNAHTPSETFGSLQALQMASKTSREGFIYKIIIGSYIYIGKKSFTSKSKWQNYKSSSKVVKRLIKRAIEMGVTPIYEVIEICDSKMSLALAETRHIHAQWSAMAIEGKLSLSLNADNGTGILKRDEWALLNGHYSQIIR